MNEMRFLNKVIIVTGASSGIGAATAKLFAKEGAEVVMVARNQEKLKNVAAECSKLGKPPLVVVADIAKDDDAKKVMDETIKKYNKLDVLVNNAGISRHGSLTDGNVVKSYDELMNTNLRAVVVLTSLATEHLIKSKGNIVNVSSSLAKIIGGWPGTQAYSISKAGLDMFSRTSAMELAAHGVRVNIVTPGPTNTDLMKNAGVNMSWDIHIDTTALKRVADPEELAEMIAYLASDKAKGITGGDFYVDNGFLLK